MNVGGGEVGFGVVPASAVTVNGEAAYRRGWLEALAAGSAYRFEQSSMGSASGRGELMIRPPRRAGLTGELTMLASATDHHHFYRSSRTEGRVGASWVGSLAATTLRYGLARVVNDQVSLTTNRVELEASGAVGAATFSLFGARSAFRDAMTVDRDTTYYVAGFPFRSHYRTQADVARAYLDAEARVQWRVRTATLGVGIGARRGDATTESERWQRVDVSLPVSPSVALMATAGRKPAVPEERLPSGSYAILGVQLSFQGEQRMAPRAGVSGHDTPRFVVLDVSGGRRSISVIGLAGRQVEIIADFTDWKPVSLAAIAGGVWHVTLPIAPGAHRVSIRIDGGAWMPPPGLPVTADEFMGTVGILLIE